MKKRLIIDTDGVTDDVRAISIALQHPEAEVVAITVVNGCVSAEQAAANVARTLRANGITERIPIYKGSHSPLINNHDTSDESFFFGKDGIGDQPAAFPEVLPSDFASWEEETAATALIRLTSSDPDITLVCIGPLTNVALALKLDHNFKQKPRQVVIMGGNYYGVGNVDSYSSAEFNFHCDPEAASIVLSEFEVPITIVPWEAFYIDGKKHEKEVDFHAHLSLDAPLASFLSTASSIGRAELAKAARQYVFCDEIAVSAAIEPSKVIQSTLMLRVSVELCGKLTRGQVVVDWMDHFWTSETNEKNVNRSRRPISFVTAYNVHYVNELVNKTVLSSKKLNCAE